MSGVPGIATDARAAIVASRIHALQALLDRHAAAAISLTTRRDFAWLTLGGQNHVVLATETGVAPVVITHDEAVVLAPVNEFERISEEELAGLPLRVVSLAWWRPEAAHEQTRALAGGGRILDHDDIARDLEQLRTALLPAEHARMEWLAALVRQTARTVLDETQRGQTEQDVAARAAARLAEHGARLPVILVAADGRIERYRHPLPTDTTISGRLMSVIVAERWGLHVAHTEFLELEPVSPEHRRAASALDHVLAAMREATRAGNTLGDVLTAARAAYADAGIEDQWTLHHQGGSIGYQGRERIATPGDTTPIRPGMAFAWNPSAVGYKLEETLYLDEHGEQRILTTTR